MAVGGAALASCSTEKSAGGGTAGTTASGAIEQRHVKSGTALLDVKIVGTGTPIVLVPGFARGAADFEEIMQGLAARGYRAIAVNARGCEGSTGHWAKTTIYEIADELYAVIKDL